MNTDKKQALNSRILKTEPIRWAELKFLQAENFKELPDLKRKKLKASIIENNFSQPFYVWENDGLLYCLDGKHRTNILTELVKEGYEVPEMLPATFVHCINEKEAAKLILVYSSFYAKITDEGIIDFMQVYDLSLDDIKIDINLPELDLSVLFSDVNKDFSTSNEELNIDSFQDEITLKLTYSRQEYIYIKQRLNELKTEKKLASIEDLIKDLVK